MQHGIIEKSVKSRTAPEEKLSDEDRRRMGERARRQGETKEKPAGEMSEEEKLSYWGRLCEMNDLEERLRRLEELAESGFDAAWLSMIEAYFAQSDARGWNRLLKGWNTVPERRRDAGLAEGHTHLGMLCGSPLYESLTRKGPPGNTFWPWRGEASPQPGFFWTTGTGSFMWRVTRRRKTGNSRLPSTKASGRPSGRR